MSATNDAKSEEVEFPIEVLIIFYSFVGVFGSIILWFALSTLVGSFNLGEREILTEASLIMLITVLFSLFWLVAFFKRRQGRRNSRLGRAVLFGIGGILLVFVGGAIQNWSTYISNGESGQRPVELAEQLEGPYWSISDKAFFESDARRGSTELVLRVYRSEPRGTGRDTPTIFTSFAGTECNRGAHYQWWSDGTDELGEYDDFRMSCADYIRMDSADNFTAEVVEASPPTWWTP